MSQTGVGERFDSALGFGRPGARDGLLGPSQDMVASVVSPMLGHGHNTLCRENAHSCSFIACDSPARHEDGHLLPLVGFAAGSIPAGESSVTLMSIHNTLEEDMARIDAEFTPRLILFCESCKEMRKYTCDSLSWYCTECGGGNLSTEKVMEEIRDAN